MLTRYFGVTAILTWKRRLQGAAIAMLAGLMWAAPAGAQTKSNLADIVGPNACAECHKTTAAIWQNTHHFKTFAELHRRKKAGEIAKKMGLKRVKAGSLCLDCHYTSEVTDGKRKPIAGISCESCHGPAKDYLKRHGEFSGKKEATETEAEAVQRWADSEAAGMIRPSMLYRLAKNCYSCHVVPQEELVNKGGHTAGSNFELVSWSQGEIRHNVWYTNAKSNPNASPERRRLMYVVGQAVELETSLRAVGEATAKAGYAVAMARRAARARARFKLVAEALAEPEMDEILAAANSARLKLNNRAALNAAADRIAAAINTVVEKYDGSTFGPIDGLIPVADKYKGSPSP